MKNKYFLRSISAFFALLFLSLSHCTLKKETTQKAKIKIGFILATMNEERYVKDREYFLNFAKEQGADVEFAACDDKVHLQVAKVEALLSKKIDVLVIQPVNGETASSAVVLAKREKVPVIAYDRIIRNADIDLYVTQDSFHVGELQAEAAVNATKGKGNYVLLLGESGHSVAEEITRGVLSVLKKHPEIKIVVQQNHAGWSTALGLATVENALTRYQNNIQAILANNDGMALGAVQALREQKLVGKVFVAGADADLAAVKDVANGNQSLTVLKGIRPLAQAAVTSAIALVQNKPLNSSSTMFNGKKEVPVINTPVVPVTKDNLKSTIIDQGFHTAEAVFGKKQS